MKTYTKVALGSCITILCIILLLVIHSCKKDVKTTSQVPPEVLGVNKLDISMLQTAYNKGIATSHNLNDVNVQALESIVGSLNVDWTTYSIFTYPDSTQVVEFAMPDDSTMISPDMPAVHDSMKYAAKTTAVFIMRKDTISMSFFMKTIEDGRAPGYVPVLSYLHYQQIPTGFTGNVLYFTLGRQFINGYAWKDGAISKTLTLGAATVQPPVQTNKARRIRTDVEETITCTSDTYDVYWIQRDGDGDITHEDYAYSVTIVTCDVSITPDAGSTPPGSVSGGSTPPTNPCNPGTVAASIKIVKGRTINYTQPLPPTGGGTTPTPPPPVPCPTVPPPKTPTPPTADPCAQTKALALNKDFIALMNALNTNTSKNYEDGYTFNIDANGNLTANFFQGLPGESTVTVSFPNGAVDGYAHDHYAGDDPTFSGDDIIDIYHMLQANAIKNPSTFTASVVTASGTSYIIKINNPSMFLNFGLANFTTLTESNDFLNTYDHSEQKYELLQNDRTTSYELGLLDALQGSGLTLFKGNSDFTSWVPIINNNNKVTNTNCNTQ